MARSVRLNIIANYVGSGWSALMGFVFVPVYISYLGIEAYGLIGLFATLQAWLSLLDLGLSPTLNREMARLRGGAHTAESIRDLLRSVETIYSITAVLIAAVIFASSGWLASHWLHADNLPLETVASALSITGLVIAFRWIGGLYRGALGGLQEQVWLNVSNVVFATLRGAGAIAVLAFVSPSIYVFFAFQCALAALETLVLAAVVYRHLPHTTHRATFQLEAIRHVWRFAAGVTAISVLSVLLTQLDKLILPALLPLSVFGYYALAGAVTGGLSAVTSPIASAVGPRFAELVVHQSNEGLVAAYHRYTQLLALILVPACAVVSLFSSQLLLLWTRNPQTSDAAAPILSLLVVSTGLNGLMLVPYMLQMAYGSTRFATKINLVAVAALVPILIVMTWIGGSIGAAITSVALNLGYVVLALPLMHRFLLPGELRRWYLQDVLPPLVAVAGLLIPYRLILAIVAVPPGFLPEAVEVIGALLLATTASVVGTPIGRELAWRVLRRAGLVRDRAL